MSLVMFDMPETPKCCTWAEPGARKYCPAFDPYLHMCRVLNDYPPYNEHCDERSAKCPIVDVLPVRLGTQVWRVMSDTIEEGKVSMLQQKADGTWKFRVSLPGSGGVCDYKMSEIGKCEDYSIHLSKAMAERALLRLSRRVEE